MKVQELIDLLRNDGWFQVRMKGSHRQFQHSQKPGTVTVAGKPSVDVPLGTLVSALRQAGLKKQDSSMRYLVIVEKGPSSFGAYVPDLPGCIAAGESKEEVLALIHEAIEFHIEGLKEDGLPVPPPASYSELIEIAA